MLLLFAYFLGDGAGGHLHREEFVTEEEGWGGFPPPIAREYVLS